jgi:ABC-type bacteriocin/lantibiotic exporter with double-glycine peptidase domain
MTLEFVKIALVQAYQQKTQWTCSAACLKAVLGHWGADVPEMACIEAIGARKGRGAETTQIVEAAKKLGFDALEMSFDSLAQAKALTDQHIPIICDIQSFNHPGKGHYVVLTELDDEAHLMDPNTPGNMRTISKEEMEQRWWDRWMEPPHHVMKRWGVIVAPQGVIP